MAISQACDCAAMWFYETAFKCNIFRNALQKRIFTGDHWFLGFLGSWKLPSCLTPTQVCDSISDLPASQNAPRAVRHLEHYFKSITERPCTGSRDLSSRSTRCNASPSKKAGNKLGKSCFYILNRRQKIKANGDALSAFGHTEQLPLKPAGPQEKTPPRRCNGFLKHRFALEGKKPPNHKIRVGLCILTEEENEWA